MISMILAASLGLASAPALAQPQPAGDQPELYLVMNLIRAYLEPISEKDGYKVKSGDVTYKFTGDVEIRVWDERKIHREVIGTMIVYALKKGGNKGIMDKPVNFDVTFDKDKVEIEEPDDTYGTGNEHILGRLAARFEKLVLAAVQEGREDEVRGLAKWGTETSVTTYYVQKVLEARGRKYDPIKFQVVDAKKLEEARTAAAAIADFERRRKHDEDMKRLAETIDRLLKQKAELEKFDKR